MSGSGFKAATFVSIPPSDLSVYFSFFFHCFMELIYSLSPLIMLLSIRWVCFQASFKQAVATGLLCRPKGGDSLQCPWMVLFFCGRRLNMFHYDSDLHKRKLVEAFLRFSATEARGSSFFIFKEAKHMVAEAKQ